MQKLKDVFVPSLFTGAVSAGLFYVLDSENFSTPVLIKGIDTAIPAFAVSAIATTVGNLAGEVVSEVIMPYIPKMEKYEKYEELIIPPALSGLGNYIAVRTLFNIENVPLMNVVLLGSGSSVAGNYLYNKIYKN